jgi:proline iminopeptidase
MSHLVELGDGRRASYEMVGEGRPTLMLPGGPGFGAGYMRGDAALFAEELKSYLIDPHGSGLSTPPSDPSQYSFAGHAAFYEEVRLALGLDEVVLVGHSFGGSTALTYSALFPDAVAACVAVTAYGVGPEADAGGGAAIEEEWERGLRRHADAGWYPEARKVLDTWNERVLATDEPQDVERMMAEVLPLYTAHPDRPDVAAGLAAMKMKGWWAADLACWKAWVSVSGLGRETADLRPLLGKIACPTLVVAGDLDFICGPAQALPIAAGIPGAHLEVIPDCAHMPALEAPQTYREAVTRFLSS